MATERTSYSLLTCTVLVAEELPVEDLSEVDNFFSRVVRRMLLMKRRQMARTCFSLTISLRSLISLLIGRCLSTPIVSIHLGGLDPRVVRWVRWKEGNPCRVRGDDPGL